jgi:hypothetical protein
MTTKSFVEIARQIDDEHRQKIAALEAAAQAAPPPTTAPGEYDEILEWLNSLANISRLCGNFSSEKNYIEAAAAIRKLTAERDEALAALAKE